MKKVYLKYTEGCCWRRLIDLRLIEEFFVSNGYSVVDEPRDADIICLETCAFVKRTEDITIREIDDIVNAGYNGELLVLGCLPGINSKRMNQHFKGKAVNTADLEDLNKCFPEFKNKLSLYEDRNDLFCLKSSKSSQITLKAFFRYIVNYLKPRYSSWKKFLNNIRKILRNKLGLKRDIYYIRISWGCEEPHCSFCVEWMAVGSNNICKPKEVCIKEVKQGLSQGYTNFAIIADNPGAWRDESGDKLAGLLKAILDVDLRVKISNIDGIHPYWIMQYKDEFLEVIKTGRVKSIMSALQAGSDRVLSLMNRRYSGKDFLKLMLEIQSAYPDIILITQVIAGFPSETFEEFKESVEIVINAGFTNATVFPYYCNPITPSANIEPLISDEEKFKRVQYALKRFGEEGILSFNLGVEINPVFQKTKAIYDDKQVPCGSK